MRKSEAIKSRMMNDCARDTRNAYKRQWAKDHPDKVRDYNRRYWEKKAQEAQARKEGNNEQQKKLDG